MSIAAVQLDWGSADMSKLQVTFAYRYYEQIRSVGGVNALASAT